MNKSSNYKRIFKNTLMLYIRMFVTLLVGLYTSRVILNVLGVADYGLYAVVGGLVSVMTLLNGAMVGASQRFFSYELGTLNKSRSHRVFCTSLIIHIAIAILFVILAETFGLWFLNTHLNIDETRILAANIVYQCSVFGCALSMVNVPYSSSIISHEKMDVYAYVSITGVMLKLAIVLLLTRIEFDKLVLYAFFVLGISVIVQFINYMYCRIHFPECRFQYIFDKKMFKEMSSFASWTILGEMGFSFKDQWSNIILNIFCGTTVNAARGVAATVNGIVNTFSSNFTMAMKPQITKMYASGDAKESSMMVYVGARISFFLMSLIAIPVLVNIDFLLKIWLKTVPEYANIFVEIIIFCSLIYTMTQPVTTAIQATGKIKWFQIGICLILMSELPIAYIILKQGGKPYEALLPSLATSTIALLFRFYVLKHLVKTYKWKDYFSDVLIRCVIVFSLSFYIVYCIESYFKENIYNLILIVLISLFITVFFIFFIGLKGKERKFVINTLHNRIQRYR